MTKARGFVGKLELRCNLLRPTARLGEIVAIEAVKAKDVLEIKFETGQVVGQWIHGRNRQIDAVPTRQHD